MKRTLLAALLWVALAGYAHAQSYQNWYDQMDSIFSQVDKSKVSTGLLYDYGIALTDPAATANQAPGVIADATLWKKLYTQFYSMRFGPNAPALASPESVFKEIDYFTDTEDSAAYANTDLTYYLPTIPIALMHLQYDRTDSTALARGDVAIQNGQVVELGGTAYLPTQTLTVAAPTAAYTVTSTTQDFVVPSSLFITNTDPATLSIEMDFGQGYQTVQPDIPFSVTYTTAGADTVSVRLTEQGGAIHYSRFVLNVIKESYRKGSIATRYNNTNIREQFFAPKSNRGGAFVTVETAGEDGVLDRPLIVIEGLDPSYLQNPYQYQLARKNRISSNDIKGNFSYGDFIGGRDAGEILIDIEQGNFNQKLEDEGLDLVFVDFYNGTEDILKNAALVADVIEWVNLNKTTDAEQNIVLGMSMGGIVARYALADMEDTGREHDTRMYISHDAPHQGAYVPYSLQVMVHHLAGTNIFFGVELEEINPDLKFARNMLESPATKQLLMYQVDHQENLLTTDEYNEDQSTFLAFQNILQQKGYPQQTRNVGISNGSECGQTPPIAPLSRLITIDGSTRLVDLSFSTDDLGLYKINVTDIRIPFISLDGQVLFKCESLPEQGTSARIYKGRISLRVKVFGIGFGYKDLTDEEVHTSGNLYPMISAVGGQTDIEEQDVPDDVLGIEVSKHIKYFTFVPSYSALDVGEGGLVIDDAIARVGYTVTAPPTGNMSIPFISWSSSGLDNVEHLTFNDVNGDLILDEVRGEAFNTPCSYYCGYAPVITGRDRACPGEVVRFTINNPFGRNVSWAPDSGLVVVNSSNYWVEVSSNGSEATSSIVATIDLEKCGLIDAAITLTTGEQSQQAVSGTLNGPSTMYVNQESTFYVTAQSNVESYEWVVPAGWQVQDLGWKAYVTPTSSGGGTVTIKISNGCNIVYDHINVCVNGNGYTCGSSGGSDCTPLNPCNPSNPSERNTISYFYPNPASGVLQINLPAGQASEASQGNYRVRVRDMQMKTVLQHTSNESSFTLDIHHLPAGLYTVQMQWPGGTTTEQLIVE